MENCIFIFQITIFQLMTFDDTLATSGAFHKGALHCYIFRALHWKTGTVFYVNFSNKHPHNWWWNPFFVTIVQLICKERKGLSRSMSSMNFISGKLLCKTRKIKTEGMLSEILPIKTLRYGLLYLLYRQFISMTAKFISLSIFACT